MNHSHDEVLSLGVRALCNEHPDPLTTSGLQAMSFIVGQGLSKNLRGWSGPRWFRFENQASVLDFLVLQRPHGLGQTLLGTAWVARENSGGPVAGEPSREVRWRATRHCVSVHRAGIPSTPDRWRRPICRRDRTLRASGRLISASTNHGFPLPRGRPVSFLSSVLNVDGLPSGTMDSNVGGVA